MFQYGLERSISDQLDNIGSYADLKSNDPIHPARKTREEWIEVCIEAIEYQVALDKKLQG